MGAAAAATRVINLVTCLGIENETSIGFASEASYVLESASEARLCSTSEASLGLILVAIKLGYWLF